MSQGERGGVFLSQLFIYPIKSVRGVSVRSVEVDALGPCHDRRWMLVDPAGEFLTQRSHTRMVLISVRIGDHHLHVTAPDMPLLSVPLLPPEADSVPVRVWRDAVHALPVSGEADR